MPVTLVKTRWTSGNLEFLDNSGNIIATWDGTNRKLTIASGAVLDASATAGTLSLAAGEIVNADIGAAAAIAFSKLAALTDGNILVGNGSNVVVSVNPSGDVDVSNAGVFSIAAGVIVNADINASAAIVGSKLATNARIGLLHSIEFNIDNGSGTAAKDYLFTDRAITVVEATVFYTEATDTAGAAGANVKLGTTDGGAELVTATALEVSKAIGGNTALTLVTGAGAVAADGMICITHTGIAATEAGKYKTVISYTVDD